MKKRLLLWTLLLSSLSLASAQSECIKGDCQNGDGECIFPGGDKYIGEFEDGLLHGLGGLYFINGDKYIGHWVKQHRQGDGRFVFADGSEYRGNFVQDKFEGKGVMKYANKNEYDGQWRAGRPEGKGTFLYANGDRFEGKMLAGKMSGQGKMYFADGSIYEGEWRDNVRHGMGTMQFADGESARGQWENGQYLADWGRLAYDGDTSTLRNCNLVQCASGKGKYTYRDGSRYIGDFRNSKPEGVGTIYYATGDRYEGGWLNHAPQGKGVMYHMSGKVVGAIWDMGQPSQQLFAKQLSPVNEIPVDYNPAVKIWAVLVGAAAYNHMPTLRFTDDDAYQLYAFLRSPEGGAIPNNQIRVLIDEDATHKKIVESMRQVFLRADANDVVLFYFSGHGLEGAFLPIDFDGFSNRLEHKEIKEILNSSQAKHKVVLADACHSGSLLAARAPIHIALKRYYQAFEDSRGGTALLLSSKGEEYSLEDRGLRSGIFSHFLIKGMEGKADANNDKIISIRELFNYVHGQVRQYTGNIQTPTLSGDFDERMPISVMRY